MRHNKLLDNLYIFLVLGFLFLPIIVIIIFSFNTSKLNIIFEGFTLKWYASLFSNSALLEALRNTLIVAGVSTILSTVIGTISAYGLKVYDFKLKKLINELIYIPVVLPDIVLGISLLCMYTLFKLELGMLSLIIAHIVFSVPYVIVSVRSVLENIDPNLEKAASDLGASKWQTFTKITVPMLMPGIMSGAQLAFTLSMDDVVISYFTAGPSSTTLPLYIYSMIKTGITPDVNAMITIMLIVIFITLTASTLFSMRRISLEAKKR